VQKVIAVAGVYEISPHCTPEDELGLQDGATGPDNLHQFLPTISGYRGCDGERGRGVYEAVDATVDCQGGTKRLSTPRPRTERVPSWRPKGPAPSSPASHLFCSSQIRFIFDVLLALLTESRSELGNSRRQLLRCQAHDRVMSLQCVLKNLSRKHGKVPKGSERLTEEINGIHALGDAVTVMLSNPTEKMRPIYMQYVRSSWIPQQVLTF
jgi:hypothetical protein